MKNVFIIINYNDFENTYKLIKNIEDYKTIDEIIVVDNCSNDESYIKLKKVFLKKLKILKTKENKGYGGAINYAAKYCENEYKECNIIISNSDIEIEKESDLKELIFELNKEKVAIISPSINQKGKKSYGWRIPTICDAIIMNIPKLNKIYENKKLNYNLKYFNNKTKEVDVVSGCFFIMRLSVLSKINYFDENVFLYYEENIISYKLKHINERILLNPNIEIKHNHSVTIDKNINEYKKLKELKKSQYYFYKNIKKSNKLLLFVLFITNQVILSLKKVKVGTRN